MPSIVQRPALTQSSISTKSHPDTMNATAIIPKMGSGVMIRNILANHRLVLIRSMVIAFISFSLSFNDHLNCC